MGGEHQLLEVVLLTSVCVLYHVCTHKHTVSVHTHMHTRREDNTNFKKELSHLRMNEL